MTSWLVALRFATREARRAKGRTALVLALILLPVLGLSFAAVSYDMFTLTTREQDDRELGSFDGVAVWTNDAPPGAFDADHVLAELPAGSRVAMLDERDLRLRGVRGERPLRGRQLDLADPDYRGMVTIVRGTAPASGDEVALNAAAMRLLGARLDSTVALPGHDAPRGLRVVAEVEFPASLRPFAVLRPGTLPVVPDRSTEWFVDTPVPLTRDRVDHLRDKNLFVRSRDAELGPSPSQGRPRNGAVVELGVLACGLGILEVVLLAGPAFAVGARRRRRELALVAANGGSPAQVRRIILADGLLLGAIAAVAGTALAVAAAFALRGVLEEHVALARAAGYRVFPLALLGIDAAAIAAGVGAALVPAFAAARTDVVAALAGRRGHTGHGRRWLVAGLCAIGAGAAVVFLGSAAGTSTVVVAGLVLAEVGLVACTPTLVGLLARLGRRLPLAPRIAVRDLARNRSSTAPAISAVMAAVLGAVAVGVCLASDDARERGQHITGLPDGYAELVSGDQRTGAGESPPTAHLVEAATAALPVVRTVDLRRTVCPPADPSSVCTLLPIRPAHRRCPYRPGGATPEEQRAALRDPRCPMPELFRGAGSVATTIVDDGTALGLVSGARGDDLARAEATLRAGGVVVADPTVVENGRVILGVTDDWDPEGAWHQITVPGYFSTTARLPIFVAVSPQAVAQAGLISRVVGIAVATSRVPTTAEVDRLAATLSGREHVTVSWPYTSDTNLYLLVLTIVSMVVALGAAGIATGLAAVDSRPDVVTLGALGASPGVRRRLMLSQAAVIAGLGSLLGAAAGFGAGWAVLAALNRGVLSVWPSHPVYPLVVPWANVGVAVLLVPVVAVAGTALFTRVRLPVERRT